MISVPNYNILTELPKGHLKNGEIAETSDDNKKWVYDEEVSEWREHDTGIQISLYDMNKQLIAQMPEMTDSDKMIEIINNYKDKTNNSHYMLLCRDINYFTLFEENPFTDQERFATLVLECIHDVGIIHDMMFTEDNSAIEIWVQPLNEEADMLVMYLFAYDAGVVYYV